jgi:transposase-like protein
MTSTNVLPILKTDSKGRVRTPAADREALLDLFEQGGMSGAAFARLHGLRYTTFAHWRHLRRKRLKASAMAPAPLFQEVLLRPPTEQPRP